MEMSFTYINFEPAEKERLHDPLGVGYPVLLVDLEKMQEVLKKLSRLITVLSSSSCCLGKRENIFLSWSWRWTS